MTKLDYDLSACLEYTGDGQYSESDVDCILGVLEGERDERNWHWIVALKDGTGGLYLGTV